MKRWTWRPAQQMDPPVRSHRPKVASAALVMDLTEEKIQCARSQNAFLDKEPWLQGSFGAVGSQFSRNKNENKREDNYGRMAQREMICQVSMNPFFDHTNYAQDLENMQTFVQSHS